MTECQWVAGDIFGLNIPADADTLQQGGNELLTRLFRASGALSAPNSVSGITQCEICFGGGTGSKLLLAVAYEHPEPGLHNNLFVKFSRNFDDPIRDRVRYMMRSEIEFAALSRQPGFPITVPTCYFADFQQEFGTGLLITERIPYGSNGLEPHYIKCMDHLLPDPLEHYKAIIKALARLAGTHKSGHLPESFYREFPFDAEKAIAEDPLRYRDDKLQNRLSRLADFAEKYPQLLPENIRAADFLQRFAEDVPKFVAVEQNIRRYLYSKPEFIALCHWNANIDNAWFWRNERGELECGLMDWGSVGQMSVAKSIYGAFSGANPELWDEHLDDILAVFVAEYARSGGPLLDGEELKNHMLLFTALMGVAYLLDAPAILERQLPDLAAVQGPLDQRVMDTEDARVQLHMLTMFLNQWETRNIGRLVESLGF